MTNYWEPGTDYRNGDVVEYEGHRYKIIQPHRSQSDWAPPIVPALWGKLQDSDNNYGGNQQHYNQQPQQSYQPQQGYQPSQNQGQGQVQQGYPSDNKVEPTHEEKKTDWFNLDDNRKKQFEIGGALAAGAALLGGGFALYKHHEKSEEQKKEQAWALSNWLRDAQVRTEEFRRNGPQGPVTWVLTDRGSIPNGAIGVEGGLYIARAYVEGGIQVGKASREGASVGYKHDEIRFDKYEILLGNENAVHWEPVHGKINVGSIRYRLVEGGYENDRTPLYIAQALYKGTVYPGKASEKLDGAYVPVDGDEKNVKEYRVLCYNS